MDSQVIAMLQKDLREVVLTPQEIASLDLATLRLLVARHVGFKFKFGDEGVYAKVASPGGLEMAHGNDIFWEIPDYCLSMTQAWALVEELRSCEIYMGACSLPKKYACFPCASVDGGEFARFEPWPSGPRQDVFESDTAEVAICRWYCWIKQEIARGRTGQ